MEMAECVIADVIFFSLPQCLNFSSLFMLNKLQHMGATENNLYRKKTEYYYYDREKFMNEWNQQLKHVHTK